MQRIWSLIRNFDDLVAGTCLVLMCSATLSNVVSRYFFGISIPWAEEFARYAFIWLVFMGAAVCTKYGRHLTIDACVVMLPQRLQKMCSLAVEVITAVFMLVLIYFGAILAASATQPTSTLKVPQYVVYLVIPLSAFLTLFYTVRDFWRKLHEITNGGERT
jgi:TRAP-type C4-dicarboxylate transport system permease small subunit